MVHNKTSLLEILHAHRAQLHSLGVKKIGIFGSFARNESNDESDLDVIVEFQEGKKSFDNFMHLSFLLEELAGRKVEIVTPESLSAYIRSHILKEVEYVNVAA